MKLCRVRTTPARMTIWPQPPAAHCSPRPLAPRTISMLSRTAAPLGIACDGLVTFKAVDCRGRDADRQSRTGRYPISNFIASPRSGLKRSQSGFLRTDRGKQSSVQKWATSARRDSARIDRPRACEAAPEPRFCWGMRCCGKDDRSEGSFFCWAPVSIPNNDEKVQIIYRLKSLERCPS